VLVGAEGPGLSEDALRVADRQVRIPMASGVDSLNVATAAAVAFAHLSPTPHRRLSTFQRDDTPSHFPLKGGKPDG